MTPATPTEANCPFCARIRDGEVDEIYNEGVVRFAPLNPVTPGHMLFVPVGHALHPNPERAGAAVAAASHYARRKKEPFNLITSSGHAATQTIPHVHVHYVPRRENDGLTLPWTGQTR